MEQVGIEPVYGLTSEERGRPCTEAYRHAAPHVVINSLARSLRAIYMSTAHCTILGMSGYRVKATYTIFNRFIRILNLRLPGRAA